jgi:hypothetical protein
MICLLTGYTALYAQNTSARNTATVYAALPVLETYVPNNVVEKLKNEYGSHLYNITQMKDKKGNIEYCVMLKNNGTTREVYKKEATLESK